MNDLAETRADRSLAPNSDQPTRRTNLLPACCALIAYAGMLLTATHLPEDQFAARVPQFYWTFNEKVMPADIVAHLVAYAGLTLLAMAVVAARQKKGSSESSTANHVGDAASVIVLVALFGLFDELTQPLTGRVFQGTDWLADVAGAVITVVVVAMVVRAKRCCTANEAATD